MNLICPNCKKVTINKMNLKDFTQAALLCQICEFDGNIFQRLPKEAYRLRIMLPDDIPHKNDQYSPIYDKNDQNMEKITQYEALYVKPRYAE